MSRDFTQTNPVGHTPVDNNGHGTQVAGIIGAQGNNSLGISGVCWDVTLVQLRVSMTNWNGAGGTQIANAIDYATESFETDRPISILNLSAGSSSENTAIRQALFDYPGLFISAADNANLDHDTSLDYPTEYSRQAAFVNGRNNVISVSSLNAAGNRPNSTAWGATSVSIFAPGADILTTHRTSNTAYTRVSGTSFATPHVVGVAALMMAVNPDLTPNQIKTAILNSATWVNITHPSGFLGLGTTTISVRRLNAEAALSAIAQFKTQDLSATTTMITGTVGNFMGSVVIPTYLNGRTVTAIGPSAFANQTQLSQITIPASVTSIGDNAFLGCTGLTSITVPSGVATIGYHAFPEFTEVDWLGNYSFRGNEFLKYLGSQTSFVIPTNMAGRLTSSIAEGAFLNQTQVSQITIPWGVASIETDAFLGCSSLSEILVHNNNGKYSSQDGILYDKLKTLFVHIPQKLNENISIPYGITYIEAFAFAGQTQLKNITIPISVTSIGQGAFQNTPSLQTVCFDNENLVNTHNHTASYSTFYYVERPLDVRLIAGFTYELSFDYASLNTTTDYEEVYTSLGVGEDGYLLDIAYQSFPSLLSSGQRSIVFTPTEDQLSSSNKLWVRFIRTNWLATVSAYISNVRLECRPQLQTIGNNAFNGAAALSQIAIPSSVTSIGEGAFQNAVSLQDVTFERYNAVHIPFYKTSYTNASYTQRKLDDVRLVAGVIYELSFDYTNLSATTPFQNVMTSLGVGELTFTNELPVYKRFASSASSGRQVIVFVPTASQLSVSNKLWVRFIRTATPEDVSIEISNIKLERSCHLQTMGNNAFNGATLLSQITIPSSVTNIGDGAFSGCSALTAIVVERKSLYGTTVLGNNALTACPALTDIYVPDGDSVAAYKNAVNWSQYVGIIRIKP